MGGEEKEGRVSDPTEARREERREGKAEKGASLCRLTLEHVLEHDGSLSNLLVDGEGLLIGGLEGNFGGGHLRRGAKGGGRRRRRRRSEGQRFVLEGEGEGRKASVSFSSTKPGGWRRTFEESRSEEDCN